MSLASLLVPRTRFNGPDDLAAVARQLNDRPRKTLQWRACAQKPEIVTWTGPPPPGVLTWNRNALNDELFPLWRTLAYRMRRSEALALRWSDVNFTSGRISVRRAVDPLPNTTKVTKTESARDFDIEAESLRVLKAHKSDAAPSTSPEPTPTCSAPTKTPSASPTPSPADGPADSTGLAPRSMACPASPSKGCATPTRPCCTWTKDFEGHDRGSPCLPGLPSRSLLDERELGALLGKSTLIPVLHQATFDDVKAYSGILPGLAGFTTANDSVEQLAEKISAAVLVTES